MRNGNRVAIFIAVLSGCLALHGGASAASFDCAKAASPRETFICGDPELSALDEQLGKSYRDHKALLSPQGAELLQRSEQGWLKYAATVCPVDNPTKSKAIDPPKPCLMHEYKDRLKALEDVGRHIGPYVFNRIDIYKTAPTEDKFGTGQTLSHWHDAYPVIDNPRSAQESDWNAQIAKTGPNGEECSDEVEGGYEIGMATQRVISVERDGYESCHGSMHGLGWRRGETTVFLPQSHALRPEDLFVAGADWRSKLPELFWNALLAGGWKPPLPEVKEDMKTEIFVDPKKWVLTDAGLKVIFSSYDGGCNACTPGPVTVPWSALKPLLSPDAVAP